MPVSTNSLSVAMFRQMSRRKSTGDCLRALRNCRSRRIALPCLPALSPIGGPRRPLSQSVCEKWHGHLARVFHGRGHTRKQQCPESQGALGTHGQDAHATTRRLLTHALRGSWGGALSPFGCAQGRLRPMEAIWALGWPVTVRRKNSGFCRFPRPS